MNEIELVLTARDNASGTLGGFGREVQRADADLTRLARNGTQELARLEGGAGRTARSVRALALPLVAELSPALGQTTSQMASIVVGAAALGTGLGAVAIAATGVAGIVAGTIIARLKEARERLLDLQYATSSFNLGTVSSESERAANDVERLNRELFRLKQQQGPVWGLIEPESWLGRLFDLSPSQKRAELTAAALRAVEARAAARELAELETGAPGMTSAELNTERGTIARQRLATQLAHRGLYDFQLGPIDQMMAQLERDAQDLGRGVGGRIADPEAAARIREMIPALRAFRYAGEVLPMRLQAGMEEFAGFEGAFFGGLAANPEQRDALNRLANVDPARALAQSREQRELLDLTAAGTAGDEALAFGPGFERASQDRLSVQIRKDQLAITSELLTTERERAALLARLPGLTEGERHELELVLSLQRERLSVADLQAKADAEDDPRKREALERRRDLLQLEEQMTRAILERQRLERDDPLMGLARGFKDSAEEFGAAGLRMQAIARGTADNLARAFSDNFFAVVTGDFKKLPDVGKSFAQAMVRTVTDELAKLAVSPILRQMRMMFGIGGVGVGAFGLPGVGPGAAQAGAIPLAGVSPAQVAQLQQAGYQIVQGANGQSVAIPIPSGTFSAAPSGAFGEFWASPLFPATAAPAGGVVLADGTVLTAAQAGDVMTGGTVAGVPSAAGQGLTVGQAVGIAGSAAAFGVAVYGAYQTGSVWGGALSGGLTGAMLGNQIYPGYGAVIGLVAGAAIGAGAGALGKDKQGRQFKAQRDARSASQAQEITSALAGAIAAATSVDELYATLVHYADATNPVVTTWLEPTRSFVAGAKVFTRRAGDAARRGQTLATVADILTTPPEQFWAAVQAGPYPGAEAPLNEQIRQAYIAKVQQLVGDLAGAALGYEEGLSIPGLGAVTRGTILPGSMAAARAQGRVLALYGESILGAPDDFKAALLMELARVNDEQDLKILAVDPASGARVTVGRWTRVTAAAPPPVSAGVSVAGVASASSAPPPEGALDYGYGFG